MHFIPSISVVMSIYNEPEEWLRESIESILNQTFTDFEFIIINDNPERQLNDALLNEYQKKDSRIVIIKNEENIGLTKSLNKGLEIAKGEYIARMDGDDISLKDRFDKQYNYLNSHPKYVVCGSNAIIINKKNRKAGNYKVPTLHNEIYNYIVYNNPMIHPSLLIRRKALIKNQLTYNEEFLYSQDYDLISRLAMLGKLANIEYPLIRYRISNQQISTSKRKKQQKFANNVRINFILKNQNKIPIHINKIDFNSFNKMQTVLERIVNLKNNSDTFHKYLLLSIITNMHISTIWIIMKLLFKTDFNFSLKEKIKIGKATFMNNILLMLFTPISFII